MSHKANVLESAAKGVAFAGRETGIRSLILFSLAFVFFMLPSLALTQQTSSKTQSSDKASLVGNGNGSKEPDNPVPSDPNYVIGPQDVLDISVWKEPDLSRSVPVRPDGKISLPLLNDVQAAGLTPSQLTVQITAGLNKFMNNPQVTVIVSQINSQRIYLLGEVARPGAFALLPGMTVLQALSDAGGLSPFANAKKIYVIREQNGKRDKL